MELPGPPSGRPEVDVGVVVDYDISSRTKGGAGTFPLKNGRERL
jgi:hypothetical protein